MTEREPVNDRIHGVCVDHIYKRGQYALSPSVAAAALVASWPPRVSWFEPTLKADIQEEPDD